MGYPNLSAASSQETKSVGSSYFPVGSPNSFQGQEPDVLRPNS